MVETVMARIIRYQRQDAEVLLSTWSTAQIANEERPN